MIIKITSKDICKKTYSFFTENHQEKVVNNIEQEFYSILRDLKNNKVSRFHQKSRFLDLQHKIDVGSKKFHFTPTLDIYMESLRNLTSSYIKKLSDTHVK